jgi:four helix bundle protein
MNYSDWLSSVPLELTNDAVWNLKVFRLAIYASDLAWQDTQGLSKDRRTIRLADQLYRAVCSVGANIAEGYSRRSVKDQARYYEYALGSAREARVWYYQARHMLIDATIKNRLKLLTEIVRMLLAIIPKTRGYKISDRCSSYDMVKFARSPAIRYKFREQLPLRTTQYELRNT